MNCPKRKFHLKQVVSTNIFSQTPANWPLLRSSSWDESIKQLCSVDVISYKHLCFNCFMVSCIHTFLAVSKIILKLSPRWAREMAQVFRSAFVVTRDCCSSPNIHMAAHNSSSKKSDILFLTSVNSYLQVVDIHISWHTFTHIKWDKYSKCYLISPERAAFYILSTSVPNIRTNMNLYVLILLFLESLQGQKFLENFHFKNKIFMLIKWNSDPNKPLMSHNTEESVVTSLSERCQKNGTEIV